MKKKIVLLIICLLVASMFVSCARANDSDPNKDSRTDSEISEPDSTVESESDSESEPEKEPEWLNQRFEENGFAVTILNYQKEGQKVSIEMILEQDGGYEMNLRAKDRFRLINKDRITCYLKEIYDMEGNSLLGSMMEPAKDFGRLEIIPLLVLFTPPSFRKRKKNPAVFELEEGFEPVEFRFVYDIQGFAYIKIKF